MERTPAQKKMGSAKQPDRPASMETPSISVCMAMMHEERTLSIPQGSFMKPSSGRSLSSGSVKDSKDTVEMATSTSSLAELSRDDSERVALRTIKKKMSGTDLGTHGGKKSAMQDQEKVLQAQIRELQRQLENEKKKKKEQARLLDNTETQSTRLVIAASRLPVKVIRSAQGHWELQESGKEHIYAGVKNHKVTWVGLPADDVPVEDQPFVRQLLLERDLIPVFIPPETADLYQSMCMDMLWPLFHYIPLSMLESESDMHEAQWSAYEEVNNAFASEILQLVSEKDMVWVHDFHLILLPSILREKQMKMKIGWFLHTPFPSSEIYLTLPRRKEIVRAVLSANLIGFHIYDYVRHFMNVCTRVLGTDITLEGKYIYNNAERTATTADAYPIGIDPQTFEDSLNSVQVKDKIIDLQRRFDGKKLVLGIDRLDYVKGIPHKLIALEKFLNQYPQWAGRIVLVQIANPPNADSTRYQKLQNKVHKLVGRINGRFGTLEHSPIQYLDQSIDWHEMCALYFLADIALITSLREGMNKVGFEFIACQQKNRGVLILSEFAGAAQALGSGAIMVNPFNTDELASAINTALNMGMAEREERHQYMLEYVNKFTAHWWVDSFVLDLATEAWDQSSAPFDTLADPSPLPSDRPALDTYRRSSRRLIVLGLLGTLIEYATFRSLEPLLDTLWKDLLTLSSDPRNVVIVVSGRERALVNQWLGDLPVWIAAEYGIFYRFGGRGEEWQCSIDNPDDAWVSSIKPVFKYFEERTPDTFTELQEYTITWHYREADEDFGEIQASDLQMHLEKVLGNMPVEVSVDGKQVQVRPYGISKGAILEVLMEAITDFKRESSEPKEPKERVSERQVDRDRAESVSSATGVPATGINISLANEDYVPHPPSSDSPTADSPEGAELSEPKPPLDYVLCLGAFTSRDEDLYINLTSPDMPYHEFLPADKNIFTCRVGKEPSQAKYYLEGVPDVYNWLANLANISQEYNDALASPMPPNAHELRPDEGGGVALENALDHLEHFTHKFDNKQLAFFLDYDGTLTPIVDEGTNAALSDETRAVIEQLAKLYPTAIVSGRARAAAQGLVQLDELYYAGSHGLDIKGPNYKQEEQTSMDSMVSYQVADSYRPALESAQEKIAEMLEDVRGLIIEDNTFSVSINYRAVPEEERERMEQAVDTVMADMPMLRKTEGKMVFELRPCVEWNKGKAVEWLLDTLKGQLDAGEVLPVYIGDDVTDEDAFRVIKPLGGVGIIVSDNATTESTEAAFSLRSPEDVVNFLSFFAEGNNFLTQNYLRMRARNS